MSGVNAKLNVSINALFEGDVDMGNLTFKTNLSKIVKFNPGNSTIAEADVLWADSRSLAANASERLDLSGGLQTAFGTPITFAEVTAMYVENTGSATISIGGTGASAFVGPFGSTTGSVTVGPGEVFLISNMNGWAVTAETGDLLAVRNFDVDDAAYNMVLIGRSVAA